MVFVRVHLVKDTLSVEQKRELGAKLIAAVAEAEDLVNSERHRQTSWVQYFEIERDDWYAPHSIGDPNGFFQLDVIAPEGFAPTKREARIAIEKATQAVRSVVGDGLLPGRGPWVQVYVIPKGQWGMDGRLPRFELAKPYFMAETAEEATRVLKEVMGAEVDPATIS